MIDNSFKKEDIMSNIENLDNVQVPNEELNVNIITSSTGETLEENTNNEVDTVSDEEKKLRETLDELVSKQEETQKELDNYKRVTLVNKTVLDAGLPVEAADFINGKTDEEISANVAKLKLVLNKLKEENSTLKVNPLQGNPKKESNNSNDLGDYLVGLFK